MKLDKDDIIEEAFALIDEKGLDRFNLRALAIRLSVSATALYWHFKDKDELMKAMAGRIYERAYAAMTAQDEWQDSLRVFGLALQDSLQRHRDSALLCILAKPSQPNPQYSAEVITQPLVAAGLSQQQALTYEAVITSFVMGWTVFNQNPAMEAYLSQMLDYGNSFNVGLDALIRGFVSEQQVPGQ